MLDNHDYFIKQTNRKYKSLAVRLRDKTFQATFSSQSKAMNMSGFEN
jgi:hypothetical protein